MAMSLPIEIRPFLKRLMHFLTGKMSVLTSKGVCRDVLHFGQASKEFEEIFRDLRTWLHERCHVAILANRKRIGFARAPLAFKAPPSGLHFDPHPPPKGPPPVKAPPRGPYAPDPPKSPPIGFRPQEEETEGTIEV